MFVPLHDGKPVRFISLQWVTLTIIVINVAVYLLNIPFAPGDDSASMLAVALGYVPSVFNDYRTLPEEAQLLPDSMYFVTGITYAFVHNDIWHLGGNMLFLWVFGDNVEDAMGHFKYLIFYLACAFVAAFFHALVFPHSDAPLIGASGAAAEIVAAYLMLHPKMRIWVLVLGKVPLPLPAFWILGAWISFQIVMFLVDGDGNVSWAAHLGGIMAGIILVVPLKRRDVALFDRDLEVLVEAATESPVATQETPPSKNRWGRG